VYTYFPFCLVTYSLCLFKVRTCLKRKNVISSKQTVMPSIPNRLLVQYLDWFFTTATIMNPRHQNGKNCMVNIIPLIIFFNFFRLLANSSHFRRRHFSFEIRPNNHEIDSFHLCDTVRFANLFLHFVAEPVKTVE
jgi:hypothetical protein